MKKLLQTLKLIKEIKSLNKNDFHIFRVDAEIDCLRINLLSEYLDKQNLNYVIIRTGVSVKSLAAKDKKELLEYIKKEIGLED